MLLLSDGCRLDRTDPRGKKRGEDLQRSPGTYLTPPRSLPPQGVYIYPHLYVLFSHSNGGTCLSNHPHMGDGGLYDTLCLIRI